MRIEKAGERRRENIEELTSLRGIAALLILFNHMLLLIPFFRTTFANSFLQHLGIVGMSLFFTLSGFVIYYKYADKILSKPKEEIRRFFIARFARLYPLYFIFTVGCFVLNLFISPFKLDVFSANVLSLPSFLLGIQTWVFGYINGFPLRYLQGFANISWPISSEMALYVFFVPLVFVKIKTNRRLIFLFIMMVVLRCVYVYMCYFGLNGESLGEFIDSQILPQKGDAAWGWLIYHSPYGRIFEFLVGCLSAKFFLIGNKKYQSFFSMLAVASLCFLGLNLFDIIKFEMSDHLLIPLALMLFIFSVVQCRSRILRIKGLVFIGEISYSTYLLHIIFIQFMFYTGNELGIILNRIVLFVVSTYVTAFFSYKYIENPARRFIRARFH